MNSFQKRKRLRARRNVRHSGMPWWLTSILALGALASICAAAGIGALFVVYQGYAEDYVPIEEKLAQTNIGLTEIFDRGGPDDGIYLGALTNPDAQLLNPVPIEEMSSWIIEATISTEDNSFWDNPGVNIRGLTRAGWEYLNGGIEKGTGGSSITQQLIKNVYICPNINTVDDPTRCVTAERTVDRKLREIVYALELDKDYSKEQVLQWYLNQISYADRYIGIQAAAQGYFHKDAKDLNLAESALLAGVPQFPTQYHPRLNCLPDEADPEICAVDELGRTTVAGDAKSRQETVLNLMVEHGRATRAQTDEAKAEVLKVFASTNPLKASAFIDNQVEPRLVRMCEAGWLEKIRGSTDCEASVHAAGYKVTTTLDYAETEVAITMMRERIAAGLEIGCHCNNASIVTIEPSTGQIIIYAPNVDPSNVAEPRVAGKIDQATEINQPGSSFKPVVYLAWFDVLGKAPMSTLWDTSPLNVQGTSITNPRNDGKSGEGLISARAALGGSQNVGAFRAAAEVGADNVIAMAKAMGITTLEQNFDPTFYNHEAVTYGASIATGGANIRVVDMAYMNSVIANMGIMVGTPTLAETIELKDLKQTDTDSVEEYDEGRSQAVEFGRGNIRLPGTRELDPVVVLEVRDKDGKVIWTHNEESLVKKEVVNPGSVWLVHSIISDCTSRFIIWGCGSSNDGDLGLDVIFEGARIPAGAKTGTQQGPKSAVDTLETWMNGYTRYAATSLWVGNSTNELVNDRGFPAANTTVKLYKNWMAEYHRYAKEKGVFESPDGFASIRPANVAQRGFSSPTTDRGSAGGCSQSVTSWVRTDVSYASECEEKEIDTRNGLLASDQTPAQFRDTRKFVKLPALGRNEAIELAKRMNIPIAPTEKSGGQVAVSITSPTAGKQVTGQTQVVGSVNTAQVKEWKLEIGAGGNPTEWQSIGGGTNNVTNAVLGSFNAATLNDGVYTIRLTAQDAGIGNLTTTVQVNVKKGPTPTPGPGTPTVTPTPTRTPTP